MRFQKSQPPPAFGGRDRLIVFMFFGVLAVFFAIKLGSDPKFWKAMRGETTKPTTAQTTGEITIDPSALRSDENLFAPSTSRSSVFGTDPSPEVRIDATANLTIPKGDLKACLLYTSDAADE